MERSNKDWIRNAKPSPQLNGDVRKARGFAAQYSAYTHLTGEAAKGGRWCALYWTRIANVMSGGYPIPGGSV